MKKMFCFLNVFVFLLVGSCTHLRPGRHAVEKMKLSSDGGRLYVKSFSIPGLETPFLEKSNLQQSVLIRGKLVPSSDLLYLMPKNLKFVKAGFLNRKDTSNIIKAIGKWKFTNCTIKDEYDCELVLLFGNSGFDKFPECKTFWRRLYIRVFKRTGKIISNTSFKILDFETLEEIPVKIPEE